MNKRRVVGIVVLVAAAAWGLWRVAASRREGGDGAIRVSGNIEVTEAQVSFRMAGRVLQRWVSEGEWVTNGQPVAELDRVELGQEVALRRADVQAAEAAVAELEAGSRPEEIEQAAAVLERLKAEGRQLDNDLARQKELFRSKVIAERESEAAETAAQAGVARIREAESRLALLNRGPREETIRAARARLEQARQAAAMAETRLGYALLTAPLTGVVLSEGAEAGEYVVAGTPIVTLAELENVWLRAYVSESDLGRVHLGARVRVTTDTYPDKDYEGRLSFIAPQAEFTPKNVQTARERVKLVYRIKVDLANPGHELKPGMPADAVIEAE